MYLGLFRILKKARFYSLPHFQCFFTPTLKVETIEKTKNYCDN